MEQSEYSQQFQFGNLPPEMQERLAEFMPRSTLGRLSQTSNLGSLASQRPLMQERVQYLCRGDPTCSGTISDAIRNDDGTMIGKLCQYKVLTPNSLVELSPQTVVDFNGLATYAAEIRSPNALFALLNCGASLAEPAMRVFGLLVDAHDYGLNSDKNGVEDPDTIDSALSTLDVIASAYRGNPLLTEALSEEMDKKWGSIRSSFDGLVRVDPRFRTVLNKMYLLRQ